MTVGCLSAQALRLNSRLFGVTEEPARLRQRHHVQDFTLAVSR